MGHFLCDLPHLPLMFSILQVVANLREKRNTGILVEQMCSSYFL